MSKLFKLSLITVPCFLTACIDPNGVYPSTYPSSYPSNSGYGYDNRYDHGYSYDRYDQDDDYRERKALERERRRIERERERLEEERRREEQRRLHQSLQQQYTPPPPVQEKCPPGFSETNRKCTSEERKRGCKDIKTNSGLRCIQL